jgi:hypothetical protein
MCSSGEKRFCETCYGGRNKCLDCRPLDNSHQDKKVSTPKSTKKKRVSFSGDDESRDETVAIVQQPPSTPAIVPSEAVVHKVVKETEPVVAAARSISAPAQQHALTSSSSSSSSCVLTNTTASQYAASALAELKKKQEGVAAVASNKSRELSKSAATEKLRQHEKDRDVAVAPIAAATQLQREREEAAAAAVRATQQQRERDLAAAVALAAQQQREKEDTAAAAAAVLQREREEVAAAAVILAQQQRERELALAAAVAAQLQREREEADAAVAVAMAKQQRERELTAAALAAQQQREHENAAVVAAAAAAAVAAQLQREREEAAAAAEVIVAQQQRELAVAAAVAVQLQRENEDAAAAEAAQLQRERQETAVAAAVAAQHHQRVHEDAVAAAAVVAQLQRESEEAAAAAVIMAQQQRERELALAAAVAAQQQREHELAAAAVAQLQREREEAAQHQQEREEAAAAIAAVAAQEQREREEATASSAYSPQQQLGQEVDDTTVGTIRKVDPLIYRSISNWPCPSSYTYLDTYQGVHPWKRKHSQPHKYYPLCRIYEHLTNIGVAIIMWQIDSSTILEELTTTNAFQRLLIEASPSLMWYRNAERPSEEIIANAFLSPSNSIHSNNNLATVVATTTTTTINLVPESSNTIIDLASPTITPATGTVNNTVTDSVVDLVDNVDQDDEKDISFPLSRREYEKGMHQLLKVLYTEPFKIPYREVNIGGKTYQLDCFHYVDSTNSSQPEFNNKRLKKYEFVNRLGENATVYRWEIKMAIITSLRMSGTKYVDRVFFAFARYGSTSCDKKYDCCAVMIVRCVNRIPVFLMIEVDSSTSGSTISDEVQSWEGYDRIKHFYVMPEVHVDYDKLSRARLKFWDMSRHLYDESRLIQIDTHRPGDMTVDRATTQQVETSWKMWAIKHGPRDILADVKIPVAERPPSRAVQIKEKAELKEAKSTITVKNVKISDLEKQVSKLQAQLKAVKAPPAAASSNKRDFQVAHDTEETHAPAKKRAVVTTSSSSNNSYTMSSPVVQPMMRITSASTASISPVVMHQASPVVVEMTQELHKTELEYSIQQKKIEVLQLQLIAAQKQAAINQLRNDQTISKARHDLVLTGIHNDQREQQQAARSRQNYINDEDRAFQKESIRRQWQVEDRQVATSKLLDMATKANELPMLQTLLSSQSSNTALVAVHPIIRSQQLNPLMTAAVGKKSSAAPSGIKPDQQPFLPPKWLPPHPAPPPPDEAPLAPGRFSILSAYFTVNLYFTAKKKILWMMKGVKTSASMEKRNCPQDYCKYRVSYKWSILNKDPSEKQRDFDWKAYSDKYRVAVGISKLCRNKFIIIIIIL